MATPRGSFGSRFGFIMAAAGSAVGLGNLWKFPYLSWENGGGGFVLVYLAAVVLLGLPIMTAEILIGRHAQASAVPAFEKLGGRGWSLVGGIGVLAGVVILAYYMVIAGWSLRLFGQCVAWSVGGYDSGAPGRFGEFLADGWQQVLLTAVFSLLTAFVVLRGVGGGIERASKLMMPVLLAILGYLVVTALTLPGSREGLAHFWTPSLESLPPEGILLAVGQAFFSLSLGLGAMIAYGSYLPKSESIPRSAAWVVACDTLVALLAGTAMFIILHSIPGLQERVSGSTVGMIFVILPELFYTAMPGGAILGPLFFVLVAFAALTSTISLGEVATSFLVDKAGWSRRRATLVSAGVVFAGSVLCALSVGAVPALSSFELFPGKHGVFDTLDHLAANWLLPLGGLATTLFAGWFLTRDIQREEMGWQRSVLLFPAWRWLLRVVAPLLVAGLLVLVATGKDLA